MMVNQTKLEEVRKIILSLLLSRKGPTPIPILERDYREIEQKRIPYRQFGHADLVGFLQSMPEHFIVEEYNGGHTVRGIASEKSKHVSSLVSRQKIDQRSRYIPPHLRQPFNRRIPPYIKSQRVKIAPDKLLLLMQYVKNNPNGVSMQNALLYIQRLVPFVNISIHDLRDQIRELSHQLTMDDNMIYPVRNNSRENIVHQQPLADRPLMPQSLNVLESPSNNSGSPPTVQTMYAAGQEDFNWIENYIEDENDFVTVNHDSVRNYKRREKTSEQLATNLAQHVKREKTDMFNYDNVKNAEINVDDYFAMINSNSSAEINTVEPLDVSEIISDRAKFRLEELLRKYPEGIWCAELPDKYLQEYKVGLNYTRLGFSSVREFTSYLPKIFYMTQSNKTEDFILYSADKRPVVPDPIDITQVPHNQYDEHNTVQAQCSNDDGLPIPSDIPPIITKSFAPDDVMNYDDDVEKILVTELKSNRQYLEVYVVEVFHPNFFWVHLRENIKRFNKMMDDLFDFYQENKNNYIIAKVALKKGLNCACVYMGRWHRGIIKSVKPDFRTTVLFYDYGTLKTYAPEDIYYLYKEFSSLPAQAIPCGLYDVKPTVGDRWKKSVIDQFIDKIADTLLAATIITIDPVHNSMMIILSDTSEEEDVHINEWLVKERLAQVGKMVRMYDMINYLRFAEDIAIEPYTSMKRFHARRTVDVNKPRYIEHYRDQSILHSKRTHRLSDVKSEDIEKKTVKSLHNVPASKKALLQMLWSKSPDANSLHVKSPPAKSPDAKSLDAKSQSKNYPQNGKSRTPKELIPLLKRLKTSSLNRKSNSNPSTSMSEESTDNENNAKQINSSRKIESQDSSKDDCYGFMNFSIRDSDEENDTKDFGTFRSLYGGRGLMEPFDWSVIREENNFCHKKSATLSNNLDTSIKESIKENKSDVEDSESKSCNQRNDIPGKRYFLNMTCMEKENFLSENNIDYDVKNVSYCIEMLKDKTEPNHTVTVMFAPNNKLKALHDSAESEDTSNSNINIIEFDDVTSSKEMKVDKNGKMCKTRADQKMENRDSNTNSESVFSNISSNECKINRERFECNIKNSFESNTNNKAYNPRYKMLLEKMKRRQMDLINNSFVSTSESSSSEQILSSSDSYNNSSDDTIISSNNEQPDTNTCIKIGGLVKALASTSEELPKNLTLDESHSDSERTRVLSSLETSSIVSSNVDSTKQCQLNQFLEIDPITSSVDDTKQHQLNQSFDSITSTCNVDDSKCQLNTANQMFGVPKIKQQMLRIVQNMDSNIELDSDDWSSSQGSIKNNKSDESKGDVKSNCIIKTCESINNDANVTKIAFAPPVYNDCDVESDESEWDAYAGSREDVPFYIAQSPK